MFEQLFINACVIISFLFVYSSIRWKNALNKTYNHIQVVLDGFLGGVMGSVLIHFSIVIDGTLIDLRFLPILLLLVFVNKSSSLVSMLLMFFYRFLFGGNIVSASISMVSLFVGYLIIDYFEEDMRSNYRLAAYMVIYSNTIASISIIANAQDNLIIFPLLVNYWAISLAASFASVFMEKTTRRRLKILVREVHCY